MTTQQTEIGCFPAEWRVPSFGDVFDIQQGKQVSKSNREGGNQKPFLRTANVFWGALDLADIDYMHFSDADETRLALKPRDLLVCEGGAIGRTAIWQEELEGCFYQNHLHRLRAKEDSDVIPEFAQYWLWYGFEFAKVYGGHGNVTTIPNLSQSRLKQMLLPLPEGSEQRQIARVLTTVQRAIEQQQAIIATTRELKRGLMHKLFTEGLRGEAQKPTEVGLVPKSWEVKRIGEVATLKSGGTPSRTNEAFWKDGTIPWVKTSEVDYCVINDIEEKITQAGLDGSSAKIFPAGTLLMAMYGQGITRGKVGILGVDAATNQACAAFFPKSAVRTGFLYQLFTFKYDYIRNLGHGANQKNLSADILKTVQIAYPEDTDEQDEIVTCLSALDDKLALAERKRGHLEDLFKTLLHQLMTAQLRVHDLDLDALGVPALD